jgi:hypothetical protein
VPWVQMIEIDLSERLSYLLASFPTCAVEPVENFEAERRQTIAALYHA